MGDHDHSAFVASGRTVACLRALSTLHAHGVMFATAGRINATRVRLWNDLTGDNDGLQDTMDTLAKLDLLGLVSHRDSIQTGLQFRLNAGTLTVLAHIPDCDVCKLDRHELVSAIADAKTRTGQWGFVCSDCFVEMECQLGVGRGQIIATTNINSMIV